MHVCVFNAECLQSFLKAQLHSNNGTSMLIVTKITNQSVQLSINVINNREVDVIYTVLKV